MGIHSYFGFLDRHSALPYHASVSYRSPYRWFRQPQTSPRCPAIDFRFRYLWCAVLACGLWLSPSPLFAHPIVNLQSPQSFIPDPSGSFYYIANANGEPGERDNNGFITKLDQDGEVTAFHFIQGGINHTTLHSPYGMAVINQTLYVADIDAVRSFDTTTGHPLDTISLARFSVTQLTGLTTDDQGRLYVSDPPGNTIYRIDPHNGFSVSIFLKDETLAGPSGLVFHPKTHHLIVTSLDKGTVMEVSKKGTIREIISNGFFSSRFHNLSGVDFDQYGSMYLSDLTGGKIWRIRPDHKMEVIAEFLVSPAGVSVDRKNHLILVPYLYAHGAEMNGLERPSNANRTKKKRTLSDYGLGFLEGDSSQ